MTQGDDPYLVYMVLYAIAMAGWAIFVICYA